MALEVNLTSESLYGSPRIFARRTLRTVLEWWGRNYLRSVGEDLDFFSDDDNVFNVVLAAESLMTVLLPLVETEIFNASLMRSPDTGVASLLSAVKTAANPDKRLEPVPTSISMADFDGLFGVIQTYFERAESSLAGGSYFTTMSKSETIRDLPVVDAMSMGISVSLATLKLLSRLSKDSPPAAKYVADHWSSLRGKAVERLRICMYAIHDSFVVADIEGAVWDQSIGNDYPWDRGAQLSVIQKIRDLRIQTSAGSLEGPFEVGWSWGIQAGGLRAPRPEGLNNPVEYEESDAFSDPNVYLYFTAVALDGLVDLWDEEVQTGEFLGPDELILANRLRAMSTVTLEYWTILASQRNAQTGLIRLQDLPWRTTDKDESEYYSIYLLNILLRQGSSMRSELVEQMVMLAKELAERGRITRRPLLPPPGVNQDSGVLLQRPGKVLTLGLVNSEGKALANETDSLKWSMYDYSPALLKAVSQLSVIAKDPQVFRTGMELMSQILIHLERRRLTSGSDGRGDAAAWDHAESVFPTLASLSGGRPIVGTGRGGLTSWYFTERVVEALTMVCGQSSVNAPAVPLLSQLAVELVNYSEWEATEHADEVWHSLSGEFNFADLRARASSNPLSVLAQLLPRIDGKSS